jgi:hypothetical protein
MRRERIRLNELATAYAERRGWKVHRLCEYGRYVDFRHTCQDGRWTTEKRIRVSLAEVERGTL